MPWTIRDGGSDCPFEVVKEGTDERFGCHGTRAEAEAQMRALYAAEPAMRAATKTPYGDANYADPGYQADGVKRYPCDTAEHVKAAWSYINQADNAAKYTPEQLARIKSHIQAAAKRFGITISDNERGGDDAMHLPTRAKIERRDELGTVDNVNFPERIITVRAVPYEQPALVEYLNEVYTETFARGSMDHLITRPNRVRVNREHVKRDTVGKVIKFWPERPDGLVADIRIAKTQLGDDTLGLAADDCLSSSIGFAALSKWEDVDRRAKTRRIKTAYLDHIALVASPAYDNADVLDVRESIAKSLNDSEIIDLLTTILVSARPQDKRSTPLLDQATQSQTLRWAAERLNKQ